VGVEILVAHFWIFRDSLSLPCNHVWAQTLPLALGWQEKLVCAFDVLDPEV